MRTCCVYLTYTLTIKPAKSVQLSVHVQYCGHTDLERGAPLVLYCGHTDLERGAPLVLHCGHTDLERGAALVLQGKRGAGDRQGDGISSVRVVH